MSALHVPVLAAARAPRRDRPRLLVVGSPPMLRAVDDLPSLLRRGDLLVVNDAATLPASLLGQWRGQDVELRLLRSHGATWDAVLFGGGGWRDRTEDRPAPPPVEAGDVVSLGPLRATVLRRHRWSDRLLRVSFDLQGDAFWSALFAHGRPVQYSYLSRPVALHEVQTPFATRPWSVEAPSAGFSLSFALLARTQAQGVRLARLTHGAGLSATGDDALDARLPLAEPFDVPAATVTAVEETRAAGGRVLAVGTTVVRALESAVRGGALRAGPGVARRRLGPGSAPDVADGLLCGVHEPGASHHELLRAFASDARLAAALALARAEGLLAHEFGDMMLVAGRRASRPT